MPDMTYRDMGCGSAPDEGRPHDIQSTARDVCCQVWPHKRICVDGLSVAAHLSSVHTCCMSIKRL